MFTLAFWKNVLEHSVTFGAAAFLASWMGHTTSPTLVELRNAAVAGGIGFVYAFVKQLGGVQAVVGVLKVSTRAKHAAQNPVR